MSDPDVSAKEIVLAAPMVGYRCNQKGCCCKSWTIPFKPSGLIRLAEALGQEEAQERLGWGLKFVLDEDTQVIDRVILALTEEDRGCRFLENEGGCEIHRRFGTDALPDLCVNFPAVPYDTEDNVELHYEAVCPSVLDQLAHDDTPYLPTVLVNDDHPGIAIRGRSPHERPQIDIGGLTLSWPQMIGIRQTILEALTDTGRPAIEHLSAVSYALDRLRVSKDPESFALSYDDPLEPFFNFLDTCVRAHSPEVLSYMWGHYKRFVWDFDRDDPKLDTLELHLENWAEALDTWVIDSEPALRALLVRFLAHRYFSIFIQVKGELIFAYGSVPHAYAMALRIAAGMCGALGRPADLGIMKASLGLADYVYRGLRIPMSALPWFTPFSDPLGPQQD